MKPDPNCKKCGGCGKVPDLASGYKMLSCDCTKRKIQAPTQNSNGDIK